MSERSSTALTFPCDFTFKIIGEADKSFEGAVVEIIRNHFPKIGEGAFKLASSKQGKYLSMSVTVHAVSQAQLDAAYQDLSASPHTIFVL